MVTFSGLLNALDGVAATEERIVFMTTNHLERLDPALIRPGRVDVQVQVGLATPSQIRRIFLRFYPSHPQLGDKLSAGLKSQDASKLPSMAQLQGYFMFFKTSPEEAVNHILATHAASDDASSTASQSVPSKGADVAWTDSLGQKHRVEGASAAPKTK
jgi:chaperone BCS1